MRYIVLATLAILLGLLVFGCTGNSQAKQPQTAEPTTSTQPSTVSPVATTSTGAAILTEADIGSISVPEDDLFVELPLDTGDI